MPRNCLPVHTLCLGLVRDRVSARFERSRFRFNTGHTGLRQSDARYRLENWGEDMARKQQSLHKRQRTRAPSPLNRSTLPPSEVTRSEPSFEIFTSSDIPWPTERPLKVYAFDPSVGRLIGNYMTAKVRYEDLQPGPTGERFSVIDYDGTSKTFYRPVDLNGPQIVEQGGLEPRESDPGLHQQMVYAVASETLQRFEYALGRRIHWRGTKRSDVAQPVPRAGSQCLNLFPHAMCEANAFYSPDAHGILFGYFKAGRT